MDYTNGGSWREAGALPSPRYGLKAAAIGGQLYVSKVDKSRFVNVWNRSVIVDAPNQVLGGNEKNTEATDEILSWEPISETWSKLDLKLATQRAYHAVTELDLNTISNGSC